MSSIWILFGGFSRLKWKRGPQADWGYIRLWHSRIVAVQQIYNSANVLWLRKTILKSVCFDFWVQTRCVGMRGIFLTHVRFSSRTILWVLSAVHLHKTSYQSVFSPADSASPSMPSTQSASVAYFLAESSYISWSSVGAFFTGIPGFHPSTHALLYGWEFWLLGCGCFMSSQSLMTLGSLI